MSFIQFTVNGKKCRVDTSLPRDTSLNAYIRYHLGLPGTKAMCKEGGCGACIVIVKAKRHTSGVVETFHVNSCLVLVFSCHNWEITTIEGLGNRLDGYSDVQKRIADFNATQCGYCTPGWAMSITSLKDKNLTMKEFEESLGSNTCRCTGFRPLMDVAKSFATDASPKLCKIVNDIEDMAICCKNKAMCERKVSEKSEDEDWHLVDSYSEDPENNETIVLDFGNDQQFIKVYNEEELMNHVALHGSDTIMLVDGNTAKGVYETYEYPNILIDISDVATLKSYFFDQNLVIGGNVSIEDCIDIFNQTAKEKVEFSYLEEFVKHLKLVAHIPVRKIGSLAGNLYLKNSNPLYQSDIFLLLAGIGATVVIKDKNEENSLTMEEFLKFKDLNKKVISKILLPPMGTNHKFRSYKVMPRNQNALAIVNAAFSIEINENVVENIKIVFGDISEFFVYAKNTEDYLVGKDLFKNATLQEAINILSNEVQPVKNPPQPAPETRKKLALGLFYKFVLNIAPTNLVSPKYRSGGTIIERPVTESTQDYQSSTEKFPLTEPVQKLEALIQSAGEAQYVNDIPVMANEVFGAFVLSTIHNGEIDEIDATDVLKIDGVIGLLTAKDIPGTNSFTLPGIQLQSEEEEILANSKIKFYGQPIAIIVASSEDLASNVAKKVKATYKNVSSKAPILTINDGKQDSSRYVPNEDKIERTRTGTDVKKVIKGVYQTEAQYHYYMEVLSCVAIPVDQGLEVYDSSQWIDLTQIAIARCLGIKESQVLVKVRRLGGGFGGKISRNAQVATACALVAHKFNVPCRFILPMQTNMQIAGRRLPCQCDYEVGLDEDGVIQYLDATIIEDTGCSTNENILSYTVGGFPNCYITDTFQVKTALVITDLPSNTFARAPGTAEGISSIEHIMEHISYAVQKDATEVRLKNMRTTDNDLPTLIEDLKVKCDYNKRDQEIKQFNTANRWKKRALSTNVMSFPVEFYGNYSAMVSIYRGDGTVTITTGGIEMGQGVNTKAAQVCAYKLGIPLEKISVIPSYSFVAANNVFSGSSIVSESVCYSIIKACDTLNQRLDEVRKKLDNPTWEELVFQAGTDEVDLTATYMMTDTEEDLKSYSAFAVVVIEVELDVLIGRYEIRRLDILEDAGLSANPKIDIGQVEGAIIQGIGYFANEKFVYDTTTGKLLTNRSLTYHVPLAADIPFIFNVYLRQNVYNPNGVLGAKAAGEMGICTAHTINHGLRKSIYESRKDDGHDPTDFIRIDVPYDTEAILSALDVKLENFLLTSS